MELKTYQKNVIKNLASFLALLTEKGSVSKAYTTLWEEKNIRVGGLDGIMPNYRNNLSGGVPNVCLKVPTGGGKTFIAANAIKTIYDAMPHVAVKAVVWLVPSDTILSQTLQNLSNPEHPYRQKINADFGGNVEVYSKAQLLNGQNFSPTSVAGQLSIFVLSYDSFRTSKKEGRKAFQENGNLATFPKFMQDKSLLLPNTDETALIQVIRSLNPIAVVDESHHATSDLSVEMLENFNPCFVLELTATPKENSNIISFVDAAQLKKANMVKLPVIVFNRRSQDDVYVDAISVRCKLEMQALEEQKKTGRYIRPIVLFQAQPRIGEESTTYDKIKATLIEAGIPQDEIAIKTSDKDELRNIDLLSPECRIRYIITVNALKEGWDCPFAYVLATVANRSSAVDVEQILGRVLRLPYTKKNENNVLNISYVITSSADFSKTLDKIVVGLNDAGFSNRDFRAKDIEEESPISTTTPESIQTEIHPEKNEAEVPEVNTNNLRQRIEQTMQQIDTNSAETIEKDEMLSVALEQNEKYEEKVSEILKTATDFVPIEVRDKMDKFKMNDAFVEEVSGLRLPQFMLEVEPSFFSEDRYLPLMQEHLEKDFTLKDKDVQIDFNTVDVEMARVDTDDSADSAPKVWQIKGKDNKYFKELLSSQAANIRLAYCKGLIRKSISKINSVNDLELQEYIDRVVNTMTPDQLSDLEQSTYPYIVKVKKKVSDLMLAHRSSVFDLWLEQGKIICSPNYMFDPTISPLKSFSNYPKSLYSREEDVNDYERKVIWALSSMENIKWWHRNISNTGFQINGPVHAYPDIIAMTTNGKILMIETKGDYLDNEDSKIKAKIGSQWANLAGNQYRYFMVFQSKKLDWPGTYSYDRFMEIVKGL